MRPGRRWCVTSHYLEEIEALAERVVVIGGGTRARRRCDRAGARSRRAAAGCGCGPPNPVADRPSRSRGVTHPSRRRRQRHLFSARGCRRASSGALVVSGIPFRGLDSPRRDPRRGVPRPHLRIRPEGTRMTSSAALADVELRRSRRTPADRRCTPSTRCSRRSASRSPSSARSSSRSSRCCSSSCRIGPWPSNPLFATQAVISLRGLRRDVERTVRVRPDRSRRTARSPGIPTSAPCRRPASRACSPRSSRPGLLGLVAILPVIVIGGLFTAAEAAPGRIGSRAGGAGDLGAAVHADRHLHRLLDADRRRPSPWSRS